MPAHEERMYIGVFSHSKRNLAFNFWDKVKLQSFSLQEASKQALWLAGSPGKSQPVEESYIQNIPFDVKGFRVETF